MKITDIFSAEDMAAPSTSRQPFNDEQRLQLKGLTVREAINKGYITSIGNAAGDFAFDHGDASVDAKYCIFNEHYSIRCSEELSPKIASYEPHQVLDLRFCLGISDKADSQFKGEPYWVLGRAMGYNLGKAIVNLKTAKVTK